MHDWPDEIVYAKKHGWKHFGLAFSSFQESFAIIGRLAHPSLSSVVVRVNYQGQRNHFYWIDVWLA